jgi:hypothetical protein
VLRGFGRLLLRIPRVLPWLMFIAMCVVWAGSYWVSAGIVLTTYEDAPVGFPAQTFINRVQEVRIDSGAIWYEDSLGHGSIYKLRGRVYRDWETGWRPVKPDSGDFTSSLKGFDPTAKHVYNPETWVLGFARGPTSTFGNVGLVFGQWTTRVPLYAVTAFFAVLPLFSLIRRARRRLAAKRGRCAACGYDLRATSERCPECGTVAG